MQPRQPTNARLTPRSAAASSATVMTLHASQKDPALATEGRVLFECSAEYLLCTATQPRANISAFSAALPTSSSMRAWTLSFLVRRAALAGSGPCRRADGLPQLAGELFWHALGAAGAGLGLVLRERRLIGPPFLCRLFNGTGYASWRCSIPG